MDLELQCGSPAGMSQLIKYFECQSKRLDRQTIQSQPVSLSSEFESLIKFQGVPILPPAMTASRRDELRQYKKDAILLEKRQKARLRRHTHGKGDETLNDPAVPVPEARSAARQINFDQPDPQSSETMLLERLGATNPLSTLATAETLEDDCGLDTINSDFMSLEGSSIPTVFSGLKLTSFKEQKISYDLDRLSKVLNVEDMSSTSGSDLSDALGGTTQEDVAVQLGHLIGGHRGETSSDSCFQRESQDTVVEVAPGESPDHTSGFGESEPSGVTSPSCASSNRSSPKVGKSNVHFSSFVTEYSGKSSGVKKKIAPKGLPNQEKYSEPLTAEGDNVCNDDVPEYYGDRTVRENLLNHISLAAERDRSPLTPSSHTPFQSYQPAETCGSDKENEGSEWRGQTSRHTSDGAELAWATRVVPPTVAQLGHGSQLMTGHPRGQVGANHTTEMADQTQASPVLPKDVDVSGLSGEVTTGQRSVTDSLVSSTSLTSSSSTIKEDLSSQLALNIVESGQGQVTLAADNPGMSRRLPATQMDHQVDLEVEQQPDTPTSAQSDSVAQDQFSPKKTNVAPDQSPPPNIRRGSYTLSEPSPALLKYRSRLEKKDVLGKDEHSKEVIEVQCQMEVDKGRNPSEIDITKDRLEVNRTEGRVDEDTEVNDQIADVQGQLDEVKDWVRESHSQVGEARGQADEDKDHSSSNKGYVREGKSRIDEDKGLKSIAQHKSHDQVFEIQGETEAEVGWLSEQERVGKAEHISKYLEQVQLHSSPAQSTDIGHSLSIMDILRSLSETGESAQLDMGQVRRYHHERLEEAKQELILRQQREMEELFVQQRRETMLLAAEIHAAQTLNREQHNFLLQNAPENIKVKARGHLDEYSPERDGCVTSSHNFEPRSEVTRFSLPGLQVKSYQHTKSSKWPKQTDPDEQQTQVKTLSSDDSFSPRTNVGRDGHSLQSQLSYSGRRSEARSSSQVVIIPPQAHDPAMAMKFDKVSAVAKGFLTRCLLRSDKAQELVKTIKDTREFAFKFQTETPIKTGQFTAQDRSLLERIVAQLQAALLDIHEIFFEIPSWERMSLIQQTRLKEQEKRVRASRESVRSSGPRISQATLKALERKRKAREAEESALLSVSPRPRTAPAATSSPRCQNHTDMRALKPLQGQGQKVISPIRQDKSEKSGHTQAAGDKQLTRPKRLRSQGKPDSGGTAEQHPGRDGAGTSKITSQSSKPGSRSKVAPTRHTASRPGKSWR